MGKCDDGGGGAVLPLAAVIEDVGLEECCLFIVGISCWSEGWRLRRQTEVIENAPNYGRVGDKGEDDHGDLTVGASERIYT